MDAYEKNTFDEWLSPELKEDLLRDLEQKWEQQTEGNCIFISAIEKKNVDELRQMLLNKVRTMYQIRYPYKAEFFY